MVIQIKPSKNTEILTQINNKRNASRNNYMESHEYNKYKKSVHSITKYINTHLNTKHPSIRKYLWFESFVIKNSIEEGLSNHTAYESLKQAYLGTDEAYQSYLLLLFNPQRYFQSYRDSDNEKKSKFDKDNLPIDNFRQFCQGHLTRLSNFKRGLDSVEESEFINKRMEFTTKILNVYKKFQIRQRDLGHDPGPKEKPKVPAFKLTP